MTPTTQSLRPPAPPQDTGDDIGMDPQRAFCLSLKAARSRRGISLDDIADATKVCVSYFTSLERGDLSRWPKGIFRRAFFRGYVQMVGLPLEETLEDFNRLFPDNQRGHTTATVSMPTETPLRLGLDTSWHGPRITLGSRITTAAIDLVVVFTIVAGGWTAGFSVAWTLAIGSIAYFTLGRLLVGDSPAAWGQGVWHRLRPAVSPDTVVTAEPVPDVAEPVVTAPWRPVFDLATVGGPSDVIEDEEPPIDLREKRPWTSDARRVRPREASARSRVRLKWPTHRAHH